MSQVLQESLGVLLPLVGIQFPQFLDLAADEIPKLFDAVLHPPPQLLLSGPRAYKFRGRKKTAHLQSSTNILDCCDISGTTMISQQKYKM